MLYERPGQKVQKVDNSPENIPLVEIQQDIVPSELCFTLAVKPLVTQVLIHLLQALQAFSQILIVDLGIKGGHRLLTQMVCTMNVKASAFLNQRYSKRVTKMLLGYILARVTKKTFNSISKHSQTANHLQFHLNISCFIYTAILADFCIYQSSTCSASVLFTLKFCWHFLQSNSAKSQCLPF